MSYSKSFLGKTVTAKIDRPLGSKHPKWDFKYTVNYGFIEGTIAPDGEELDAYILKIDEPLSEFTGICVAIIHRTNDDDDKLIVIPIGQSITDEEIRDMTYFQERYFKSAIVR
ncbi:inorganic diphosphatase [Patescibacteria group bacterium]|nr:inorganic diphosphatase [Patescibacteria group bacterium]